MKDSAVNKMNAFAIEKDSKGINNLVTQTN